MDEHSVQRAAGDRIRLTGLRATGYHGVFPEERRDGQEFVADLVLHLDTRAAAASDRLDRTVDYGGLALGVTQILEGEPADLIETVAERIAALALSFASVDGVDVVVHKPGAPITVPFADVTVEVHRNRSHPAVVPVPGASSGRHGAPAPAPDVVLGVPDLGAPVPPVPPAPAAPAMPAMPPVPVPAAEHPVPDLPPVAAEPGALLDVPSLLDVPPLAAGPGSPATSEVPGLGGLPPVADRAMSTLLDDPDSGLPDRLDEVPDEPVPVVLALGSNLGSSQEILRRAIADLGRVSGVHVTGIAPLARTGAVGGPEQPDFLNTVVLATCALSPRALLRECQGIEEAYGRVRDERWGARTLDIDLVRYGSVLAVTDDLELPHPRAHARAFVLEPWAQIEPDAVLPGLGGGPVAQLATTAPDRDGIRWLALDWWTDPEAG